MADVLKTVGATGRDYSTWQSWEADLDNGAIYAAGDVAIGEGYDDAAFTGHLILNGGTTIGLANRILTVASGHRHDGTAGTGVRIVETTAGHHVQVSIRPTVVEWLEVDGNQLGGTSYGIYLGWESAGTGDGIARNCLVHGVWNSGNVNALYENGTAARFAACIAYDVRMTSGTSAAARGLAAGSSSRILSALNCVVYGVHVATGSGASNGFAVSLTNKTCTNCIAGGVTTSGTGGAAAFSTGTLISYALSDDASASGTGSIANGTLGFVSTTSGAEDLHITSASDAVDAGTDLGTIYGVNIDIDGRDRDAEGDTWDIGADEYVSAGSTPLDAGSQAANVIAPSASLTQSAVTLAAGALALAISAPTATLVSSPVTLDAGTQTLTVEAPTATLIPGAVTLDPGTHTVTLTAPAATLGQSAVTLAAGVQAVTATAPDATISSSAGALPAGTQTATVTAPTVALAQSAVTLPAGAQLATVTAPDATLVSLGGGLQAGEQTVTVTAPDVALNQSAVTLAAGSQALAATAPDAALVPSALIHAADAQAVTVTAPTATLAATGSAVLAAGAQTATVTAPVAVLAGQPVTVEAGTQTVAASAPTAILAPGVATLAAGSQFATVTAPTASLLVSGAATLAAGTQTVTVEAPTAEITGALVVWATLTSRGLTSHLHGTVAAVTPPAGKVTALVRPYGRVRRLS